MEEKRQQAEMKKVVENAMKELDSHIEQQCELLASQLVTEKGYEIDSFEIHTQNTIKGNDLKVEFFVVTKEKEITFNLTGGV